MLSCLSGCACACHWPTAFSAYGSLRPRLRWAPSKQCHCGALQKQAAQAALANQAVLKIPHKLLKKMSAQEQTAIIAEVGKDLLQLFEQVNKGEEGEEAAPAYMDED